MKLNKYGFLSLVAGLALGLSACTDEAEYTPAEQLQNDQVFFSSTESTDVNLEADQSVIPITISRVKSNGDLTVSLTSTVTDQTGATVSIFTIPSSATFSSGQTTATVNVGVDFASVDPDDTYTVSITIDGESSTPYGKRTLVMDVYYAPWSEWELLSEDFGTFSENSPYGGWVDPVFVLTRQSLLDENRIQYMIPSYLDETYGDYGEWPADMIIEVNLNNEVADGVYEVTVPVQSTGLTNVGPMMQGDIVSTITMYPSWTNYFGPISNWADASYFNPETGVITMTLLFFDDQGPWNPYTNILQLPGYPDIAITGTYAGSYVSENGKEYALVNVVKGDDVASYAVTMVSGWLEGDADAIQEIADALAKDTQATLYTESQQMQFQVSEDGYYTVVALSYNEAGEVVATSAFSFYYELVQRDWTVVSEDAVFTDGFWLLDTDEPESWTVTVQESVYYPGYYRIYRPYGSSPYVDANSAEGGAYYMDIDATNPNAVEIPMTYTEIGYYVASYGSYFGLSGSGTFDGNTFSFPGETLLVYLYYGGNYDWFFFNDEDSDILVLNPTDEAKANISSRAGIAPLTLEAAKRTPVKSKVISSSNPRLKQGAVAKVKAKTQRFNEVNSTSRAK